MRHRTKSSELSSSSNEKIQNEPPWLSFSYPGEKSGVGWTQSRDAKGSFFARSSCIYFQLHCFTADIVHESHLSDCVFLALHEIYCPAANSFTVSLAKGANGALTFLKGKPMCSLKSCPRHNQNHTYPKRRGPLPFILLYVKFTPDVPGDVLDPRARHAQ